MLEKFASMLGQGIETTTRAKPALSRAEGAQSAPSSDEGKIGGERVPREERKGREGEGWNRSMFDSLKF